MYLGVHKSHDAKIWNKYSAYRIVRVVAAAATTEVSRTHCSIFENLIDPLASFERLSRDENSCEL